MLFLLLASCKQKAEVKELKGNNNISESLEAPVTLKGPFVHMVFFWLKEGNSPEDIALFENNLKEFIDNNKHVLEMHIGKPAMTPREVVDNSYSYSLVTTFKSVKEHDAYQVDQAHLDFIEQSKHLWERVQVYDSILD